MDLQHKRKLFAVLVFVLLAMQACNFPKTSPEATQDPGLVFTVAAHTLEAEMTRIVIEGSSTPLVATRQPPEVATITPSIPTQTPDLMTDTPTPSLTATHIACDKGKFIKDITIEDGTTISAGEPFEKIWRLKNDGSCTWNTDYEIVFESGTQMGAPDDQQLTSENIAPGREIDVHVNLVAPDEPGKYVGNFKLRNSDGTIFGLGDNSKPFWVEIRVPDESGVRFDFLSRAKDAEWGSGTEPVDFANPGHISISYGGPDTDENGFVMIKDQASLENGKTSAKILLTHPKWVENGYIIGKYPAYKVGPGDFIKAHLGFIVPGGTCAGGEVVYEIHYIIDNDLGTRERLGKWSKNCDEKLLPIELSLADLKGEDVRFYLVVLADGPPIQDWAIWSSLGVMR